MTTRWCRKRLLKCLTSGAKWVLMAFRLDAVPYLFEREGTNGENLPETHAFLKKLRAHIDKTLSGNCISC